MIIRKSIQLTGIVTVLCLTTVFSFTHTTNKENGKRERTIKEAQELSFREKNWQIEETKHFIIFSHRGVSHIRKKLDKELKSSALQIARRIGYEDFQLYRGKGDDWDKKFKFFIYGSHESWLEAQKKFGRSERVSAWAAGNRTIFSYHLNLSTKILLHEMAHEIHNEYIRYRHSPIWWKEGIAMFSSLSESEIRGRVQQARFRVINNTHIPLMQLIFFYEGEEECDLVYNVGLSVVVFLLNEYGASSFTAFNKAMREGKNFESALSSVYDIRNISKLNDKWEEALQDWKTWESMIKNLPKMLEE